MIKVVLDTNIFVSGILNSKGAPGQVLKAWHENKFVLTTSKPIIKEIKQVLNSAKIQEFLIKHKVVKEDLNDFFSTLSFNALVVKPSFKLDIIKEDPADNKFLECALMVKAEYIVSGDKHLLKLKMYENIKIISAYELINLYI